MSEYSLVNIGENIKKCREEKNISQRELGRRINKTGQYVSYLENDRNPNPSISTLMDIANGLNVKIDRLLSTSGIYEEEEQYIIQDSNGEYIKIVEYGNEVWFYRVKEISFATAFKTKEECEKAIKCDLIPHINRFVPYGLKELKIKKFNTTYHLIEEFEKIERR